MPMIMVLELASARVVIISPTKFASKVLLVRVEALVKQMEVVNVTKD